MNELLQKLEAIHIRFVEVGKLIVDPEIIADMKRYVKLNKEYKDLSKLMEKGKIYKGLLSNQEEALEIIKDGSDQEMVEMAKLQLDEAKEHLPTLEEEIKLMLIPI